MHVKRTQKTPTNARGKIFFDFVALKSHLKCVNLTFQTTIFLPQKSVDFNTFFWSFSEQKLREK